MRLWFAWSIVLVLLSACARPLTSNEIAFAKDMFHDDLDVKKVRVAAGFGLTPQPAPKPLPPRTGEIKPRPGVCDRVAPQGPSGPPPAWALYNQVSFSREFYRDDLAVNWPNQILLPQSLIMAHELVHVWQWQNRDRTGYRPAKAGLESVFNLDPYFYVPDDGAGFLEYGFEQQAALLEDYLCYGMFDQQNPRRAKLRVILQPYFRVDRIDEVLKR